MAVVLHAMVLAATAIVAQSRPASRPDPEPAIRSMDWIARHQSSDGRWSSADFVVQCQSPTDRCADRGHSGFDVGLTGLIIYGYLCGGYDSGRQGRYQAVVVKGLRYLESVQDSRGRFGPPDSPHFLWSHACATLAMRHDHHANKQARSGRSAKAALDAMTSAETPWPWKTPDTIDAEAVRAAAWALLALCLPGDELRVDRATADAAIRYLDGIVDRGAGVRVQSVDSRTAREADASVSVTLSDWALAATLVARKESLLFVTKDDLARVDRAEKLLRAGLRASSCASIVTDAHSSCFLTLAVLAADFGSDAIEKRLWPSWSQDIRRALVDRQVSDGCERGSWAPVDALTREGGRVHATALMNLALITSYRSWITFR
jgi:hypothetical protein